MGRHCGGSWLPAKTAAQDKFSIKCVHIFPLRQRFKILTTALSYAAVFQVKLPVTAHKAKWPQALPVMFIRGKGSGPRWGEEGRDRGSRHTAANVSTLLQVKPRYLVALLLQLSVHLNNTSVVARERRTVIEATKNSHWQKTSVI